MLDLDEIEKKMRPVGNPDLHALIAELRKLREENARLEDLLAEWYGDGCCTPSDEMFAEARYIAERRKGRA